MLEFYFLWIALAKRTQKGRILGFALRASRQFTTWQQD